MSLVDPVVSDFKSYFDRDFPFGISMDTVRDSDIQKGIDCAALEINTEIFGDQAVYTRAYLLLSAHHLVMNIKSSTQGMSGSFSWLPSSKSVASVSIGSAIPQFILDNPQLALLSKTNYGAQYLHLLIPLLTGNVGTVAGATLP